MLRIVPQPEQIFGVGSLGEGLVHTCEDDLETRCNVAAMNRECICRGSRQPTHPRRKGFPRDTHCPKLGLIDGRRIRLFLFVDKAAGLSLRNHSQSFLRNASPKHLHTTSPVTGSLQLKHFRVAAAELRQRVMISFFRDFSVFQHYDSIGHPHRRKSVGDE